jgi:hypothetical protein
VLGWLVLEIRGERGRARGDRWQGDSGGTAQADEMCVAPVSALKATLAPGPKEREGKWHTGLGWDSVPGGGPVEREQPS